MRRIEEKTPKQQCCEMYDEMSEVWLKDAEAMRAVIARTENVKQKKLEKVNGNVDMICFDALAGKEKGRKEDRSTKKCGDLIYDVHKPYLWPLATGHEVIVPLKMAKRRKHQTRNF